MQSKRFATILLACVGCAALVAAEAGFYCSESPPRADVCAALGTACGENRYCDSHGECITEKCTDTRSRTLLPDETVDACGEQRDAPVRCGSEHAWLCAFHVCYKRDAAEGDACREDLSNCAERLFCNGNPGVCSARFADGAQCVGHTQCASLNCAADEGRCGVRRNAGDECTGAGSGECYGLGVECLPAASLGVRGVGEDGHLCAPTLFSRSVGSECVDVNDCAMGLACVQASANHTAVCAEACAPSTTCVAGDTATEPTLGRCLWSATCNSTTPQCAIVAPAGCDLLMHRYAACAECNWWNGVAGCALECALAQWDLFRQCSVLNEHFVRRDPRGICYAEQLEAARATHTANLARIEAALAASSAAALATPVALLLASPALLLLLSAFAA